MAFTGIFGFLRAGGVCVDPFWVRLGKLNVGSSIEVSCCRFHVFLSIALSKVWKGWWSVLAPLGEGAATCGFRPSLCYKPCNPVEWERHPFAGILRPVVGGHLALEVIFRSTLLGGRHRGRGALPRRPCAGHTAFLQLGIPGAQAGRAPGGRKRGCLSE